MWHHSTNFIHGLCEYISANNEMYSQNSLDRSTASHARVLVDIYMENDFWYLFLPSFERWHTTYKATDNNDKTKKLDEKFSTQITPKKKITD